STRAWRSDVCSSDLPEVVLEHVRLIPVLTLARRIVGTLDALDLLRFAPGTGVAGLAEPIEEITHTDDDMETAARAALREDVTVLPIGDREGRLVGILPIKDAAR